MKTRDRPNFSKKQVKSKTFSVALFVAAILIFSAIPTIATPGNTTKLNKINMDTGIEEIQSTGLPPRSGYVPTAGPDLLSSGMVTVPAGRGREGYIMYMEHAVSGGGAERFSVDTDDPGTIVDDLGDSEAGDFLSGGTYGCDNLWYGSGYIHR